MSGGGNLRVAATTCFERETRRMRSVTNEPLDTQPRKWQLRALPMIVAVLFLVGSIVLLYPSTAAWINQYQQSEMLRGYTGDIQQFPQDGLAEAIDRAHIYNEGLTGGALLGTFQNIPEAEEDANAPEGYMQQLSANASGLMARLKIPAIDVDLPIYHGTSNEVLQIGVGHLEGTALPVGGADTHSVLTAHRGLAESTLFTHLDKVATGDRFTVEVFGETLTYEVHQTQVVEPTETETLLPVVGEDLMTLVTCTPLGINSQRILVTGERVFPTPQADLDAAGKPPEVPGFPWWAVTFTGVLGALGWYVWAMGRPVAPKQVGVRPVAPTKT